jgi:hypothetical protein
VAVRLKQFIRQSLLSETICENKLPGSFKLPGSSQGCSHMRRYMGMIEPLLRNAYQPVFPRHLLLKALDLSTEALQLLVDPLVATFDLTDITNF